MDEACSAYGGEDSFIQGFWFGKPEVKIPPGRKCRRWEDNFDRYSGIGVSGHGQDQSGSG
jgi:hypothetical protein